MKKLSFNQKNIKFLHEMHRTAGTVFTVLIWLGTFLWLKVVFAIAALNAWYWLLPGGGLKVVLPWVGDTRASTPVSTTKVEEFLSCRTLSNTSSRNYFIPTKTSAERTAFYSNPPTWVTTTACAKCWNTANTCSVWTVSNQSEFYGLCGWNWCAAEERLTTASRRCTNWTDVALCVDDWSCAYAAACLDLSCLTPDTLITMADGSQKEIINVQAGDQVLGTNGNINTVLKSHEFDYSRDIYAINGEQYFVTDSHPIMTTEGRKSFAPEISMIEEPSLSVTELQIGDFIVTEQWNIEVYSIQSKPYNDKVYNLTTIPEHVFYANGILTHNIEQKTTPQ